MQEDVGSSMSGTKNSASVVCRYNLVGREGHRNLQRTARRSAAARPGGNAEPLPHAARVETGMVELNAEGGTATQVQGQMLRAQNSQYVRHTSNVKHKARRSTDAALPPGAHSTKRPFSREATRACLKRLYVGGPGGRHGLC